MGDVHLCLHGINGDVAVEFAEGATMRLLTPTGATSTKVEKWSRDGRWVEELLFAGNSLAKASVSLSAQTTKVETGDQAGSRMLHEWPPFRGIVPASGPQYPQRVGSEERLGMATTIAFSSVGVLSSTPAYWICNLEIRLQREPSIQIVRNCLSKQRFFAWPFPGVRRPTGKRF
jgi:hypothetical protein